MTIERANEIPNPKVEPIVNPQPSELMDEMDNEGEQSLTYQCALAELLLMGQEVPEDKFDSAEQKLNSLSHTEDIQGADGGIIERVTFDMWDTVDPITIKISQRPDNLWSAVKIAGRLISLTAAQPLDVIIDGEEKSVPARIITFEDKEHTRAHAMAFPEALLPKDIDLYLKTKKLLTFLGSRIYVSSKGNKSYRFFLHGIIPGSSMSDLVATRTSDKYAPGFAVTLSNGKKIGIPVDHPYLLVEKMGYREGSNQDGKDLFNHIKKSLMDNLKILGANFDASHLETGIEFVILQALSQGKSGGFSNKLHGLIIGPPNTGKSLLTDAAKVINPIVGEISVVGPKITAAGLIGKVKSEGDVSVSTGGSIPAASGGTFIIQDFHSLSGDKRATIHEIFSLLMEKGVVRDDTSANATLDAEVSLLIDTNRYHQVLRTNPPEPNTYRDLDIPINILSRYDFILDIPKDAIRQEHIADNIGLLASAPISTKWQDELKTLIAFLRDVYGGIIVPDDVEKYAKSELQKLFKKFRSSNFETNIQDHQPRIARSQRKYVLAIARAWARPVISTDHVDFAMKFIQEKVSFLASQSYDELNKDGRTIRKATRAEWILQQFADGRNFRLDDLKALYDREYPSIDPRTIKRDIQLLMASKKITRVRHGVYAPARSGDQVPSPEKHVNRKKKAKNQKISKRRARKMVRRKKS